MGNKDIKWATLLNLSIYCLETEQGQEYGVIGVRDEGIYEILLDGESEYISLQKDTTFTKKPISIKAKLKGHLSLA